MSGVSVEERDPATAPTAPPAGFMSLTLVGSGVSTGVPVIGHLGEHCACADAIRNPLGPNCRNNVSLLITVPIATPPASSEAQPTAAVATEEKPSHDAFVLPGVNTIDGKPVRCVLIDCGKTFRAAYFRVLVRHHVRICDALFLTHDHADAVAGLDDMRDLQGMHMGGHEGHWFIDQYIPTYLTSTTLGTLEKSVGYILRNSHVLGSAPTSAAEYAHRLETAKAEEGGSEAWSDIGIRRSTALEVFTVPEDIPAPVYVPALNEAKSRDNNNNNNNNNNGINDVGNQVFPFYTVPVEHGKGYISLGFVFGHGTAFRSRGATAASVGDKSCVAYISDVTDFPAASMAFMKDLVKIDVLYVDMLFGPGGTSNVHYSMNEVAALVVQLKPRKVFCIGMYCEVEHHAGNELWVKRIAALVAQGKLAEGDVESVQLGYDGMELILPQ